MALINCPHCGKQISDKAIVCPYCGVETQKLLSKIREKERQQRKERKQLQKKRRKRVIITMASVCVVAAIAVLAYLYYIDALNSIPAEYRKQTEGYFKNCESAISDGDFESGNRHLNLLKSRTLTNRQAKRVSELEIALIEEGLGELDNNLAQLENISDDQIDPGVKESIKQKATILSTYNLDASHAERLKKAKDKFVELFLSTIEKRVDLKEDDTQVLDSFEFEETRRLTQELQEMELSTTQSTRLDNAMAKAKRIKELKDDNLHKQLLKTIRDEYIRLLSTNRMDYSDYSDEGYFLYDIDNNGVPELWIKTGTCRADSRMLVFSYNNGSRMIYEGGDGLYYKGDGYVLEVYGQMGFAEWRKLTYNGTSITSAKVFEEDINGTNRDYKKPKEKYINFYPLTNKQPILNAFKEVPQHIKETQPPSTTPKVGKETVQSSNNTKESKIITEKVNIEKDKVEISDEEEIFSIVEEMPAFPGGEDKLMEYIGKNINYPMEARETGIQGRVFVGFVVEPDGSVSNVKLLRGIGGGCDEEAMRVIQSMPKWKPGKQRGKAARVSYQIPVFFKLPK